MSDENKNAWPVPYKVGYKNPPSNSRFKKRQSGNPKGRPKGKKSIQEALSQALNKIMTVREGCRVKKNDNARSHNPSFDEQGHEGRYQINSTTLQNSTRVRRVDQGQSK
jgi:hypothetical protein